MSTAGAAGGAAQAAAIQALKASGAIVRVEPDEFLEVVYRQAVPLVVRATGGFFWTKYMYLTSYKGLAFYTKSSEELELHEGVELAEAKTIWVPM